MSIPNTGYIVNNYGGSGNNLDLSEIFQSGASSVTTGYKISSTGKDLGEIFQPWDQSSQQASLTGYKVGAIDLNQYFQYENLFTATGTYTSQYVSSYYIITFTNSTPGTNTNGSIIFNKTISNVSIICVGGGGGGGAGFSTPRLQVNGKGGGGGGNYQLTGQTFNLGQTYTTSVGYAGLGGSLNSGTTPGGHSNITRGTTDIIYCTGGGGAAFVSGGSAGTVTAGGSGGSGGAGGNASQPGSSSSSYPPNTFQIPAGISGIIQSSYSGGGAGCTPLGNGGGAGSNGLGGSVGGSTDKNGSNASTYGSGGGGASNNNSGSTSNYNGGNGASGVIIIYFQYP